jgi:D-glycero-D-manno-heptose 1,7-bisphosphate phosphatase
VTASGKRALFLDRDGVINHDSGYTSSVESFRFIDGIFELCRAAKRAGYLLIVVTNQAGIGRGYYSEQNFLLLTQWMCNRFDEEHASLTDVFHCPYHPEHGIGMYKQDSFDRKPHPGMLLRAAKKYDVDLKNSIMIGDKDSDMVAASNAGIGIRCHFLGEGVAEADLDAATHKIHSLRESILLLSKLASAGTEDV